MPEAKRRVDMWSPGARAAYEEFNARVMPSFKRMVYGRNTPDEKQSLFEYMAIEKEAKRLYYEKLDEL